MADEVDFSQPPTSEQKQDETVASSHVEKDSGEKNGSSGLRSGTGAFLSDSNV
jgi:hypothetical protein